MSETDERRSRLAALTSKLRLDSLQRVLALGRRSQPLWWYPSLSLVAGLLLGFLVALIGSRDYGPLSFLVYEGDPASARSFVSLAASSVATITSLTLTITVVTLQLASSQYSPRLIEHYLNDRGIRAVMSLFLMTFAFAVATLLNVRFAGDGDQAVGEVPGPAISLLIVLIVSCLGALVFFVYRVTQSIRVESILALVRDRTLEAISARNAGDHDGDGVDEVPDPDADGLLIRADRTGFFVDIDRELISEHDATGSPEVWVLVSTGDFVIEGVPVAVVSGWDADDDEIRETVHSWLRFDTERWIEADYSYGVRSLTDVALKALSPGINDPTTGVMAVHRIAEVMAVAARSHPDRIVEFAGDGRLYVTIKSWEWTLHQTLHQIALYGGTDVNVVVAVLQMLWSLLWVDVSEARREEIEAAVELFAELIAIDRLPPDQAVIDQHLDLLRESITCDEPIRSFRREAPPLGR